MRGRGSAPPLFFLFKHAHQQLVTGAARRARATSSAPPAQISALVHLDQHPGITIRELGDLLGLNSAGATGLVGRLERAGFVKSVVSKVDRRAVTLHATARGTAIARKMTPVLDEISRQMTTGFAAAEIVIIRRFCTHVAEMFEAS